MIRLRYAWSSLHVLPYFFAVAGLAYLVALDWSRGGRWLMFSLVYFVVLGIQRLVTVEFLLGERWMRVPGPHPWYKAVVPTFGWSSMPRPEPRYSEGRLVRLADVARWSKTPKGVELRMRDGSVRSIPFHGLRPRDALRVLEYLDGKLGGAAGA
jgi:hypothetical protein